MNCGTIFVTGWNRTNGSVHGRLDAQDWKKVLAIDFNIVCETRAYRSGNMIYVRFRNAENPRQPTWINGKQVKK